LPLRAIGPAEDECRNSGDPQTVSEATLVADVAEAVDRGDEVRQEWFRRPRTGPVEADLMADDRPREGIVDARRGLQPQPSISIGHGLPAEKSADDADGAVGLDE